MTLQNRLVASLCISYILRASSQYNGDFVLGNIPVPEEGWLDKDLHIDVLYTQTQHSPADCILFPTKIHERLCFCCHVLRDLHFPSTSTSLMDPQICIQTAQTRWEWIVVVIVGAHVEYAPSQTAWGPCNGSAGTEGRTEEVGAVVEAVRGVWWWPSSTF